MHKALGNRVRPLVYIRDLLWELALRDLKIRYKGSFLGVLWSLINPLAQVLVFTFLFKFIIDLRIEAYTSFIFIGVLGFSWFQTAVFAASGAVTENPTLARRPGFPVALLPVIVVLTSTLHFCIALPALFVTIAVESVLLSPWLVTLPFVMLLQLNFTLGICYVVAALNVRFRDTQHITGVLLNITFYLTPVFYSTQFVPERLRPLFEINPLAVVLSAYRTALLGTPPPSAAALCFAVIVAVAVLAGGFILFHRASVKFVDEL